MNDVYIDDFDWFDGWCEHHYDLLKKKNYLALVQHCIKRLERDPQDEHSVEALAEAYVLNGQYQESIDMFEVLPILCTAKPII